MANFTETYHRSSYPAIDPSNPANSQAGRTILITGSTAGIGFAASKAFLTAGAEALIVTGRREDKLAEAVTELESRNTVSKVIGRKCDVASADGVTSLWSWLKNQSISIDTLVLNAATLSALVDKDKPFVAEVWRKFEVNVLSSLRMTEAFLAQGPELGKIILNVTTARAHANPQSVHDGYGPSKLAITKSFEAMADHTPRERCRVVNVNPGIVKTDAAVATGMTEDWMFDDAELSAAFFVWVTTKQADFLHGRLLWSNWDVDELVAMKERFEREPGLLRIGLNGVDNVHPRELMAKMKEMHSSR